MTSQPTKRRPADKEMSVHLARPVPQAARLAGLCRERVAGRIGFEEYRRVRRSIIAALARDLSSEMPRGIAAESGAIRGGETTALDTRETRRGRAGRAMRWCAGLLLLAAAAAIAVWLATVSTGAGR